MAGYHLYPSKIFFNVLKSGNYPVKSTIVWHYLCVTKITWYSLQWG